MLLEKLWSLSFWSLILESSALVFSTLFFFMNFLFHPVSVPTDLCGSSGSYLWFAGQRVPPPETMLLSLIPLYPKEQKVVNNRIDCFSESNRLRERTSALRFPFSNSSLKGKAVNLLLSLSFPSGVENNQQPAGLAVFLLLNNSLGEYTVRALRAPWWADSHEAPN